MLIILNLIEYTDYGFVAINNRSDFQSFDQFKIQFEFSAPNVVPSVFLNDNSSVFSVYELSVSMNQKNRLTVLSVWRFVIPVCNIRDTIPCKRSFPSTAYNCIYLHA